MKGHIHVESSSFSSIEGLPDNIPLGVLDSEGSVVGGLTSKLVLNGVDQSSAAVYEFSMWASAGGKFTFVPRDARCVNYVSVIDASQSFQFHSFCALSLSLSFFPFPCSLSLGFLLFLKKKKILILIRNFKEYDLA